MLTFKLFRVVSGAAMAALLLASTSWRGSYGHGRSPSGCARRAKRPPAPVHHA